MAFENGESGNNTNSLTDNDASDRLREDSQPRRSNDRYIPCPPERNPPESSVSVSPPGHVVPTFIMPHVGNYAPDNGHKHKR